MSRADADPSRPADSQGNPHGTISADRPSEPTAAPRPPADVPASDLDDDAMPRGCPFLVAEAGGWRLGVPSRDHRCSAVSPAAPLSPDKQIRLCLTPAYASCATYLASVAARTERLGAVPVRRATRWGLARTTSVIEDRGGLRSRIASSLTERARWPAVPAVLLVVTLFALALSGFRGGTPAAAGATASPRPSSQEATPHPTRPAPPSTPAASAEASMPPGATPATPQPTPTAAVTPRPSASFRTYVVEAGDTLGAIANRFGTTVRAIAELNGIADPSRLQIGQVLRIP